MKPYFYQASISSALLAQIAGNVKYFQEAMRLSVEAFGGRLIRCHLLAESSDPIGFLEFSHDIAARAWSSYYGRQNGVLTSKIKRLLDEDDLVDLDDLISKHTSPGDAGLTKSPLGGADR